MMEWKLLQDEAQLKELVKPIKKECRGHFYTNYQFLNSTTDDELKYTEFFYAQDGNNIYIVERKDECYQLSYAIGNVEDIDITQFPQSVKNGIVCCDVIEVEGKEKQGPVVEKMILAGFKKYKTYHMWELDKKEIDNFNMDRFRIIDSTDEDYLKKIYDIFDPYADMLPLRRQFPDYIANERSFSCLVGDKYAGSNLYRIIGSTGIEDFVYRTEQFPGTGAVLCVELLNRCFNEYHCNKVFAWIADDNISSIKMHELVGFTRSAQYKSTYIKSLS